MSYPDKATPEELADSNVEFGLSGDGLVIEFVDHTHCQVARIPYPNLLQWLRCEDAVGVCVQPTHGYGSSRLRTTSTQGYRLAQAVLDGEARIGLHVKAKRLLDMHKGIAQEKP